MFGGECTDARVTAGTECARTGANASARHGACALAVHSHVRVVREHRPAIVAQSVKWAVRELKNVNAVV